MHRILFVALLLLVAPVRAGARSTSPPTARFSAGKDVRYENAFFVDRARKEATFSADGGFVDEE